MVRKTVCMLVLAGGCFSDGDRSGAECSEDCATTGDAAANSGSDDDCLAGCGSSGGTDGATDDGGTDDATDATDTGDTGATDTGDTGATDTGDTGGTDTGDTGGTDTGDTGATDTDTGTSGPVACAANSGCEYFEVCSAGLGQCIPADSAAYEITIVWISIPSTSGFPCYADPDENPCVMEFYVKALVGGVIHHESIPMFTTLTEMQGYSFEVNLAGATGFSFEVWDSDDNEPSSNDDLLFQHIFNTPPAVLHAGWVEDMWGEGVLTQRAEFQLRAL